MIKTYSEYKNLLKAGITNNKKTPAVISILIAILLELLTNAIIEEN